MKAQGVAISRQPSAISKDIALNLIQGPFLSWIPSQARNDVTLFAYYASGSQSIPKHDIHQSLSLASDCLLPKPTPQVSELDCRTLIHRITGRNASLHRSLWSAEALASAFLSASSSDVRKVWGLSARIGSKQSDATSSPSTLTHDPYPPSHRLGCLPYLNVKPLVYTFEHGGLPDGWELVYAPPSQLARMLAEESIAAAPVSSFASLSNPNLSIVPGISISSDGPVISVLMLSKVELKDVKTVAADISSLSSRALLRIILSESYGMEPEYIDCEPKLEKMLSMCDAALIIGDPAMLCDKTGLHLFDLGEEWLKLTGLPAVFATWAGPKESITPGLIAELKSAKEEGQKRIREIVEEQSPRLGLPPELCKEYLTKIIRYDLGQREMESLRIFGQKAAEHGLISCRPEVRVVEE
ncbi:MAG: menaquinone biosynthesis protein [Armatimonadota bacterium]